MNRRNAGLALLLGLAFGAAPLAAEAQQAGKVYRIGYLSAPTRESVEHVLEKFSQALRELGWVEGQNLIIEYRWAEGKIERLPDLAAELVRPKVDLIVAPAGSAALAAKNATSSIPIVMIFPSDPVEMGLVASLSHPGGNITGTTYAPGSGIFGKQLQILKETIPAPPEWTSSGTRQTQVLQLEGFDSAFGAMAREQAHALLVGGTSTFLAHRTRIAELAVKGRLPTMYNFREAISRAHYAFRSRGPRKNHRIKPSSGSSTTTIIQSNFFSLEAEL